MSLQQLLNEHVLDSKNTTKIFKLAQEYDRLGQGAMAVSLYIKAADLEETDKLLQYKCLLGIAKCYHRQNNRRHTVIGVLLQAAALMPERQEAHYFLCKLYEESREWRQCLVHANVGLLSSAEDDIDVGYPGKFALYFYQALATWYISGTQPGKHLFFDLKYKMHLDAEHREKVDRIINSIHYPDTIPYKKEDLKRYKFPFDGIESIEKNYSKHFQDMFILTVLNGKKNGTYLEIGAGDPFIHNNTALLETQFGWRGISIDISEALAYKFKNSRKNTVICANALEIDYRELFSKHCLDHVTDFLQIDCDDASVEILKKIPFNEYKFGVIQFEHDSYRLDPVIKETSRKILQDAGYVLLVNDVAFNEYGTYEDWWVHPCLVNINSEMKSTKKINFVWDYFMKGLE
jgi:hypothetical protein